MFEALQRILAERGMAPHGYCLLWDPTLIWMHVIADAMIGFSYFSIPIVLAAFLTRRRDVEYSWVVWMFAAFIVACGTTHFISIWTLWVPAYGIEGVVKLLTALVSVITAIALWPLLPRAVALPSPAQLGAVNSELRVRIAERDEALDALNRETAERLQAEAMLRQSQKMDAVGQLTGGIAHDFNNMLAIVFGNVDRARRLAKDRNVVVMLDDALEGAQRAALLVDQLLAFARKQPLQPARHDLNEIVRTMEEFLERALGDVRLELDLAPDLPIVEIDRNQAENAILNIAINARAAMPEGGVLSIATAQTARGIELTMTDDGCGMPADVLERVFEPFFTTKAEGQGTGLGLSQVYGFVKQSGGDVHIQSSPRQGTAVTIVLPAARQQGSRLHEPG